jgi:hypothetical protein
MSVFFFPLAAGCLSVRASSYVAGLSILTRRRDPCGRGSFEGFVVSMTDWDTWLKLPLSSKELPEDFCSSLDGCSFFEEV